MKIELNVSADMPYEKNSEYYSDIQIGGPDAMNKLAERYKFLWFRLSDPDDIRKFIDAAKRCQIRPRYEYTGQYIYFQARINYKEIRLPGLIDLEPHRCRIAISGYSYSAEENTQVSGTLIRLVSH